MIHVLIADDHALVRDGLKHVLKSIDSEGIIEECSNADDALTLSALHDDLDLVILDLVMPGMNGFSGLKAIRSQRPNVPVLILSGFCRRKDALAALELGVAGFIPKGLESASMENAIRLVLSGDRYFPADFLMPPGGSEDAEYDTPLDLLSEREEEILAQLMEGLTNKEIGRLLKIEEVQVLGIVAGVIRNFE